MSLIKLNSDNVIIKSFLDLKGRGHIPETNIIMSNRTNIKIKSLT